MFAFVFGILYVHPAPYRHLVISNYPLITQWQKSIERRPQEKFLFLCREKYHVKQLYCGGGGGGGETVSERERERKREKRKRERS